MIPPVNYTQRLAREFHVICKAILQWQKDNPKSRALDWAAGYARAGLEIRTHAGLRAQALYLRNNLSKWRGDYAKATRAKLDALIKELNQWAE